MYWPVLDLPVVLLLWVAWLTMTAEAAKHGCVLMHGFASLSCMAYMPLKHESTAGARWPPYTFE